MNWCKINVIVCNRSDRSPVRGNNAYDTQLINGPPSADIRGNHLPCHFPNLGPCRFTFADEK